MNKISSACNIEALRTPSQDAAACAENSNRTEAVAVGVLARLPGRACGLRNNEVNWVHSLPCGSTVMVRHAPKRPGALAACETMS